MSQTITIDWRDSIPPGIDGIYTVEGLSVDEFLAFQKRNPGLPPDGLMDTLRRYGYPVTFIPNKESTMSAPDTPDKPYVPQPDSLETMPAEGHAERGETTYLEITNDPISARLFIQQLIDKLRGPSGRAPSREIALAITKLQEARFWLGEELYGVKPG